MKGMQRGMFRAVESSQIILGFIECVKDLDFVTNVMEAVGGFLSRGMQREP